MQADEKEFIKHWIKTTPGMSRKLLSTICQVSKRTLDNWLTGTTPIPPARLAFLKTVIQFHEIQKKNTFSSCPPLYTLEITFSQHDYYAIINRAARHQSTPSSWIREQIRIILRVKD